MSRALSDEAIGALDPYQLMGELGKRVIHPGGSRSTEQLLALARLGPGQSVLEVGCGVGATAIRIARRVGARVTAVDIDEAMLERAERNVHAAGVADRVELRRADILELPFEDGAFDAVLVEAVTMFVDRDRAAGEVVRVCRPGGRVADHEFVWRRPPTAEARRIFTGEICPGISFDDEGDWAELYRRAGLREIETATGPFAMMTPLGFLRDEGLVGTARIVGRALSRRAYLRRLAWLMPRMRRAMPYLGSVVVVGSKP